MNWDDHQLRYRRLYPYQDVKIALLRKKSGCETRKEFCASVAGCTPPALTHFAGSQFGQPKRKITKDFHKQLLTFFPGLTVEFWEEKDIMRAGLLLGLSNEDVRSAAIEFSYFFERAHALFPRANSNNIDFDSDHLVGVYFSSTAKGRGNHFLLTQIFRVLKKSNQRIRTELQLLRHNFADRSPDTLHRYDEGDVSFVGVGSFGEVGDIVYGSIEYVDPFPPSYYLLRRIPGLQKTAFYGLYTDISVRSDLSPEDLFSTRYLLFPADINRCPRKISSTTEFFAKAIPYLERNPERPNRAVVTPEDLNLPLIELLAEIVTGAKTLMS